VGAADGIGRRHRKAGQAEEVSLPLHSGVRLHDDALETSAKGSNMNKFTDRDIQLASLALLIGLAEKLTGEQVVVYLKNAKGGIRAVGSDPNQVIFEHPTGAGSQTAESSSLPPTTGSPCRARQATPPRPRKVPCRTASHP